MSTEDGRKLNPILRGIVPSATWNMTWIDRSKSKRVVPMKVLVLGWPRTGSKSTSAALYTLGFDDVYHFSSLLENPYDCRMWMRAINAKWHGKGTFTKKDWDGLLGHCQAVTDFPCAAFADELIAAYPDAKVLLNVRPTEKWYASVTSTVWREAPSVPWYSQPFVYIVMWFGPVARLLRPVQLAVRSGITGGDPSPEALRKAYDIHNEHLIKTVPAERLLLWGPQDGWEPLCKFLDLPIPSVAMPFVNESQVWTENMKGLITRDFRYLFRRTLLVVGLTTALFVTGRKYGLGAHVQSLFEAVKGYFF